MTERPPPKGSRDRQQRVPSGPRPSGPRPGQAKPATESRRHLTGSTIDEDPPTGQVSVFDTDYKMTRTLSPESGPSSPPPPPASKVKSPKAKPTALRLNTLNLLAPAVAANKPMSPSLQHWQQVRSHVLATPAEERAAQSQARKAGNEKKKFGLMSKAAGRFGIKQAADRMMRGDERRKSTKAMDAEFGGLSLEEREEIARERRRFARDIKGCLDACAIEESRRRLIRLGKVGESSTIRKVSDPSASTSTHGGAQRAQQQYDTDFYAFAPLLTELHKYMPAARARKPWSRTCPHHAAILAELRTAFLGDSISTDGERQQALEVFGTVVRTWSAENPEEELARWLWLCKALSWDDRALRDRGLALLESLLQTDGPTFNAFNRPFSALSIQSFAVELIQLLRALETSRIVNERHVDLVSSFISGLGEGQIIDLDETTVGDLIDEYEFHGSQGGVCREMVWAAAGVAVGRNVGLADWLLCDQAANLKRFCPPTILHGAPPSVIHLRARAIIHCLTSFAATVNRLDQRQVRAMWWASTQHLEPDVVEVESGEGDLALAWASYLLAIEAAHSQYASKHEARRQEQRQQENPFMLDTQPSPTSLPLGDQSYRDTITKYLAMGGIWRDGLIKAAQSMAALAPLDAVVALSGPLLASKELLELGQTCVEGLWKRITLEDQSSPAILSFLRHLQAKHPQVLYRPLFACAAAGTAATLSAPLRLANTLAKLLGPDHFWLRADPEMVAIVIMGHPGQKADKGKSKEGQIATISVKLGRYAMIVELLKALEAVSISAKSDTRLQAFAEKLESRVALLLDAEEKRGSLPDTYRALLCRLFFQLRLIASSVKRPSWRSTVIRWTLDADHAAASGTLEDITLLQQLYGSMGTSADKNGGPQTTNEKRMSRDVSSKRRSTAAFPNDHDDGDLLSADLKREALRLLVLTQSPAPSDEWMAILPMLWDDLSASKTDPPSVFLFMQCCEKCPEAVRALVTSDMTSEDPSTRAMTLRKLARLYGWRYQILTQDTLTDRRGPVFHFTVQNLGYAATEIGVPHWVQPQEVQDAALQKFGNTLPLELRQRLMELGWSEDDEMVCKRDWEHLPLTLLPPLQSQAEDEPGKQSPSPMRLNRTLSSGSGQSITMKRRKAVFAPLLMSLVAEQALLLSRDMDAIVSITSTELVRLFQRDDAPAFFRTMGEGLQDNLGESLVKLRAVATTATPGFAFAAVNALVGHSRTVLRNDPGFPQYVDILTTIAMLMPALSGVSLRDIRKNRSEHVLLPASIHEDEGGYKLHAPWREGNVDAQTAQLLILGAILRNNPRDVYLVKKMLSNLQVQSSIHSLAFSRAWLLLIAQLFGTVNRNYTDRAELRHFLSNVSLILVQHHDDLFIVAHAMRVFMLCSARFRRVYASVGFHTTMASVYTAYANGSDAIKDGVEYGIRSFYRIHSDSFVHQACVTISEINYNAPVVYRLLSSLSVRNSPTSGVASGLRGLNQKEEIDALVQMISGPELAFSEIGTAAAARRAAKIASIDFEETVFPKQHIVKLFVTVIAADPASRRAIRFLDLFAGMVPSIDDRPSQALLRDSVEALGRIMVKGRAGDELAARAVATSDDVGGTDWVRAKAAYLDFVDAFARAGGQLSAQGVRRVLQLVPEILDRSPSDSVGRTASSIIGSLAHTFLTTARPAIFLRDIAPLFRTYITTIDYSGLLDSITALIIRSSYDLDEDTISLIIEHYVQPSVKTLGSASEANLAFALPLRTSTVKLLAAAVFLRGDAWSAVDKTTPTAGLLASVILPFTLLIEAPTQVDRDAVYSRLWIRLLNFVLSGTKPRTQNRTGESGRTRAAQQVLVFQIVKIVCIRAPNAISAVRGLWNHLANRLSTILEDAEERIPDTMSPNIVDWMLWSLYELLTLHRMPLMTSFRHRIQLALSHGAAAPSRLPSPASRSREGSTSPSVVTTPEQRPRLPSLSPSDTWHKRVPSFQHESNLRAKRTSIARSRPSLSPNPKRSPNDRQSSRDLRSSPQSGFGSSPGTQSQLSHGRRPSFADMTARRASRPAFDVFQGGVGMNYRFPSSATVRQLPAEKGGGAIVHLLGAPGQVSSAIGGGLASPLNRSQGSAGAGGQEEVCLANEDLISGMRRAIRTVQIVFGHEVDLGDDNEPIRTWTAQDALHVIAEQSRLLVENEFGDLFNPPPIDTPDPSRGYDLSFADDSYSYDDKKPYDDDDDDDDVDALRVPILNIHSP